MASKHRPQRSCVVCREKTDKRSLTRLIIADSRLRIDETGKRNGRGAYLCQNPECWELAASRSFMSKALRRSLDDNDRKYLLNMMPS